MIVKGVGASELTLIPVVIRASYKLVDTAKASLLFLRLGLLQGGISIPGNHEP